MTDNVFEYGNDGPSRLVVGVDGSRTSMRAVAYAAGQARRHRATLVVVFVTGVNASLAALTPQAAALDSQAEDEWATELRAELATAIKERGYETEVLWERRQGDPAHEIAAVADEQHADGVVVGASESLGHRVLGSTAMRLVRAGHWPVTVVP